MTTVSAGEGEPGPTRASRRAAEQRALRAAGHVAAKPVRVSAAPATVVATMTFCVLVAFSAYADPVLLAAAVGFVGVVLAWGWQPTLGGPSVLLPSVLTAVVAVVSVAVAVTTSTDPFLRLTPLVLAVGLVLMFVHQLLRRDGRPRLTESVAVTALGLALVVVGSSMVPLTRTMDGADVLAVGLAAVGAGSLADLLTGRGALHRWMLPVSMLLGGWAAVGTALLAGAPRPAPAALLGLLVAAVSHALRRTLSPLPTLVGLRGQVTSAAASVLCVGVLVYAFARVVVG